MNLEKNGVIKNGEIDYKRVNELLSNCSENEKMTFCDLITSRLEEFLVLKEESKSKKAPIQPTRTKRTSDKRIIDCSSFSGSLKDENTVNEFIAKSVPHDKIIEELGN